MPCSEQANDETAVFGVDVEKFSVNASTPKTAGDSVPGFVPQLRMSQVFSMR